MSHRIHSVNDRAFSLIDSEEKAYWLGFITADGCVRDNSLQVSLARKDREHLCKLRSFLHATQPVTDYESLVKKYNKRYPSSTLHVRSSPLFDALVRLGVTPRKSHTVQPCTEVPDNLLPHYWRGVFDGDGSISRDGGGKWALALTGNMAMCIGFRSFVQRAVNTNPKIGKCKESFQVCFAGTAVPMAVAGLLYSNCSVFLDRKYEKALTVLATKRRRARDIQSMPRKLICFTAKMRDALHLEAKRLDISISEVIRIGMAEYFEHRLR